MSSSLAPSRTVRDSRTGASATAESYTATDTRLEPDRHPQDAPAARLEQPRDEAARSSARSERGVAQASAHLATDRHRRRGRRGLSGDRIRRGRAALRPAHARTAGSRRSVERSHRDRRRVRQGASARRGSSRTDAVERSADSGRSEADGLRAGTAEASSAPRPVRRCTRTTRASRRRFPLAAAPYLAPEQFEGLEADSGTDIFAFGAVIYEMLTGRQAFEGKTLRS